MDHIFAIGLGLGLRFLFDAVIHHDTKITGTLVGLWEGVIMLHFTKKTPKSSDPFIAYGVRLLVDFLFTDSVTRLLVVLTWTALGMMLADVTAAIWDKVGLERVWRDFRRDLYTISRMIPTISISPQGPPPRTVRFSKSKGPSIITNPHVNSVSPPSVITTEQTNTIPPATAPVPREIPRRRVPSYFPTDLSETDTVTELSSVQSSGEWTSGRASVNSDESNFSHDDFDDGNLSSVSSSTERPDQSSLAFDVSTVPGIQADEAALADVAAADPAKDEDEMTTPKPPAAPYLPPTPSDSGLHFGRFHSQQGVKAQRQNAQVAARKPQKEREALKKKEEKETVKATRLKERPEKKKAQDKAEILKKEANNEASQKKKREDDEAAERKRKEDEERKKEAAAAEIKRQREEELAAAAEAKRLEEEEEETKREEEAAERRAKAQKEAEKERLKEEAAAAAVAQAIGEKEARANRIEEEEESARIKSEEEARLRTEEERQTEQQEEAFQEENAGGEEKGRTGAAQAEPISSFEPLVNLPSNDAEQGIQENLFPSPLQANEFQDDEESIVSHITEYPLGTAAERLHKTLLLRAHIVRLEDRLEHLESSESDQEIKKQAEANLRKLKKQADSRYYAGMRGSRYLDPFDNEDTVSLEGTQPKVWKEKIREKLEALLRPNAKSLLVKIVLAKESTEAENQKHLVDLLLDEYNLTSYTSNSENTSTVQIPPEKFAVWLTGYRTSKMRG